MRWDYIENLESIRRGEYEVQLGQMTSTDAGTSPSSSAHKKKILVISQFYAPDITAAAFRISETVGLLRQDADVRVITAVPHKAQAEAANPRDDTGVIRVAIRPYQGGGAVNYIMHYLSFVVTATWAGVKLKRSGWRPDIIWVSSPPLFVGIAGDALRRIMGCPLVLDIRDIWPESAVGAKMISQDGLLFRLGKILERWLYARADRMTCVSQAMQGYLVQASGKTVHVVYNGILRRPPQPPAQHVHRRILYAGNLGRAQGLDVLIAAFADARKRSKALAGWTVDFVGAGAIEDALRAGVDDLDLGGSVRFLGVLDKPSALAEMRQSAALFINLLSEAVFALTVPSKVFDCMLAGRPILYGVENPEAQAILAESGGNIEFTANDRASLADAIVDLATRLDQIETLAQGNSDVVLSRYTREEATRELFSALDAAQKSPRPTFWQKLKGRTENAFRGVARQLAFARHVPLHRLLRRQVLTLQRTWLQTFPPGALAVPDGTELSATLPEPLMPPRLGSAVINDDSIVLTLLGETKTLQQPISWHNPTQERETQLWWMTLNYMEYLEEVSDESFASLVESWITSAQPFARGYWRDTFNSYTVSIRTVIWMQQLACRRGLPQSLRRRMADSIAAQLNFLERNLETDLGGNHLVKNIKALILGSVYFCGTAPRRWRNLGLKLLATELPRQILKDGVHFERSLSYHNQVFVDLLEIRHTLGIDPLGGQLDRTLANMAQVIADLAHGDGKAPQFSDAGLHMSYASKDCLDAYEKVFARRPSRRSTFAFADAGYFGLGVNGNLFVADCGLIGPDDLPGHGHGDILSFEWSVRGRRLIVDQGVYEYVSGARRADARSSRTHNTLSIAGYDQADFFGDFRVGRRPRPQVLRFDATENGFVMEGRHNGYAPMTHLRRFEVTANKVTVIDRVEGALTSDVVVGLLLHPDASPSVSGAGIRITLGDCSVMLHASVPFEIEPAVWWPDLGKEVPTTRLVAHWPAGVTTASFTLLVER